VATRRCRSGVTGASDRRAKDGTADDGNGAARRRSSDRLDDHANRGGIAVYQTARFAYAASHQAAKVDALKSASSDFTAMRRLAMRFRGILRSRDVQKLVIWLDDAQQSGLYAMQRFAQTVRRDLDAVTNALTEGWSNGQTEGHINRLKTLKRAMYGRAGVELLRARMLPLQLSTRPELTKRAFL